MSSVLFLEKKVRCDKLGILYLSRILKDRGHNVDLIQDDIEDTHAYLKSKPVDFIMYSVMTGEHQWFIRKNKELKKMHDFKSVFGGPHFTFFPEDGISDSDVDFIVQGPGEDVVIDILEGKAGKKLLKGNIPDDINAIPSPDRSILYKYDEFGKSRMKRFMASRDCPYSCKYCFNHLYHQLYKDEKNKFFQITAVDKMIEEIQDTRKKYGLELVYFNDDDLARDHDWLFSFCKKLKKEVGVPFCGSIRANSVNYNVLKIMAAAGCTFLNIAIESANPKTQKFLRRGNINNKDVEDACLACRKLGIKVRLQNMIGLPVDDPLADALETLEYNIKIDPTDSWAAIFQPLPKTDLWKHCLDNGLIKENTSAMNFYEDTPLLIKDAEKINRLHKWWFFIVKHKIPINLVNILLELPLTKEQKQDIQDFRWKVAGNLLYGI